MEANITDLVESVNRVATVLESIRDTLASKSPTEQYLDRLKGNLDVEQVRRSAIVSYIGDFARLCKQLPDDLANPIRYELDTMKQKAQDYSPEVFNDVAQDILVKIADAIEERERRRANGST